MKFYIALAFSGLHTTLGGIKDMLPTDIFSPGIRKKIEPENKTETLLPPVHFFFYVYTLLLRKIKHFLEKRLKDKTVQIY